jgi:hypothetical protein
MPRLRGGAAAAVPRSLPLRGPGRYGMSPGSPLNMAAIRPESSETTRTIAGVITARMIEYSANV